MTDISLVQLGKIQKPITELVKSVSKAIGKIYEPIGIKRAASAKVAAKIIEEKGKIEIEELKRRAKRRIAEESIIQQKNIESIVERSVGHLNANAAPDKVNVDWLSFFFEKAKLISDEEMQNVWAKILAEESNNPGIFKKRTLSALAELEKMDAQLFRKLCSYVVFHGDDPIPFALGGISKIMAANGLQYNSLAHLESIGLIKLAGLGTFSLEAFNEPHVLRYFNHSISFKFKPDQTKDFQVGDIMFTSIGEELIRICGPEYNEAFFDGLTKYFDLALIEYLVV